MHFILQGIGCFLIMSLLLDGKEKYFIRSDLSQQAFPLTINSKMIYPAGKYLISNVSIRRKLRAFLHLLWDAEPLHLH